MDMKGLVIRNTGSHYLVLPEGKENPAEAIPCRAKGNLRLKGIRTTNPVAVGDRVTVADSDDGHGVHLITAICPRSNYIIRRASNLSKQSHIIAANLDLAVLVVTLAHPLTATTFIDRFLATAEAYRIPAAIAVNKVDLLADEGPIGAETFNAFCHLYSTIGYPVLRLCAATGQGLDSLKELLHDKVSLLSGNSGVGKSTIINALIPGADVRTAAISAAHDQGTHTTTFSQMFFLPGGGAVIDTPGIRGFGTIEFDRYQVSHYFPEIFRIGGECRFDNCTHTHEPGCAVLRAVEDARVAQSRYDSYLSILRDDTEGKYRQ